tara:strand:- start:41348 stop:41950 length:603 start_codon:yes stop_codon:yes gene_type:complete
MKHRKRDFAHYVGIDEAGRGPIAGPVCIGLVAAKKRVYLKPFFEKVRDSKQLCQKRREEIFDLLTIEKKRKHIFFTSALVGPSCIDRDGITCAIRLGIKRSLRRAVIQPSRTLILLDGGLFAPSEFKYQETIIRGDERESLIALASIVAKVTRDKRMKQYGNKYPDYLLEKHKGYGTKEHYKKLKKHGISEIHRTSFIHL